MTGRELIIYILQNNLENVVIDVELENNTINPLIPLFITEQEAAIKFNVGLKTIRTWYYLGELPGKYSKGELYILRSAEKPSEV